MRQIILDTETTGLDPALGHRVIELAAVEIVNRCYTGNNFHRYINPERASEQGALEVHGLSEEFLRDKPKFSEVVREFLDFVDGAELIIHNAPFDVAFLNRELDRLDLKAVDAYCPNIVDTLYMARDLHPGKKNSLDALCDRYQIDNSARTLHGALLDASLLAEVYLAMTRGQDSLMIDIESAPQPQAQAWHTAGRLELIVVLASAEELAEHERQLVDIDKASNGATIWRKLPAFDRDVPDANVECDVLTVERFNLQPGMFETHLAALPGNL
jgi:DNA polymerase-3 subunit epsilon